MNKTFVLLCVGTLLFVQLCSAQSGGDDAYLGIPCNQCINVGGSGSGSGSGGGGSGDASYLKVTCGTSDASLMVQCTDSACKSCTSLTLKYGSTLSAGAVTISIGSPFTCQLVSGKQYANSKCTGTGVSQLVGISGYCDPSDNTTIVCSQGSVAEKTCNLKTTLFGPFTPTSCFSGGSKYMEVACGATAKCIAVHTHTAPPANAYSCGKCQPNLNAADGTFATASCGAKSVTLKYECNKGCSKCSQSFTTAYNKASSSQPMVSSPFACNPVSVSVFSSSKCAAKSLVATAVQFTGWCSSPADNNQVVCSSSGFALQTCDKKPKPVLGPFAAGKCFNTHDKGGDYAEATCAAPTTCIIVTG